MDLLGALLIFAASSVVAILVNLVSSDLYDRCSNFSVWLITKASRRLPQDMRGRYLEEWHAHLDELPSQLSKIWHAAGCFFGTFALEKSIAGVESSFLVVSIRAKNSESIWISRQGKLRLDDLKWLSRTIFKLFRDGERRFGISIERQSPNHLTIQPTRLYGLIEIDEQLYGIVDLGEKDAIAMKWRLSPESQTDDK